MVHGKGPATRYSLSPQAHVTMPLDLNTYFEKDIDQRQVQEHFNFELIRDILPHVTLFTEEESSRLHNAQSVFSKNLEGMSELEYRKEMERLGVDLSWKSSQIEGNTYSLFETERLLKEKKEASGKSKEETIMLLNHKDALDFVLDTPDFMKELKVNRIEQIHSILTQELAVDRNIRQRRVGITGYLAIGINRGDFLLPRSLWSIPSVITPHPLEWFLLLLHTTEQVAGAHSLT